MPGHVLLIHGWSAPDKSMAEVGHFLTGHGYQTADLFLGGYPSMSDDVRVEDSARRMQAVITEMQGDGRLPARFHLVVHSTGALVARRWLADNYASGGSPVDNLLMLAPANFGSPLATLGRSLLTRVIKGWKRGFQTGTEFLHALELGSCLQQDIALVDRLSPDGETASPFSTDGTRPFVIVGACQIPGTQILGEEAWDGTVRIASANIDPQGMTVDFTNGSLTEPRLTPWTRRGPDETPFAVLPDRHHLTVLRPDGKWSESKDPQIASQLSELILAALGVKTGADYARVAGEWTVVSNETRKLAQDGDEADALRERILGRANANKSRFNEFYQIVVEAVDETGLPVDDYRLWLTAPKISGGNKVSAAKPITQIEIDAQNNLIKDGHRNRRNNERRVLHIDRRALMQSEGFLKKTLTRAYEPVLAAAITAASPGEKIAYFSKDARAGSGLIRLRTHSSNEPDGGDRFLRRYATHFIRIIIPRVLDDDVFTVRPLD
ncbi:esterase/lipase family protein [Maricaulis salignorans]|uniref:esterase/lipase family protein n=1 Tax=Maricaulis salignorans TaxID=144026 RepID=UPI003A8E1793